MQSGKNFYDGWISNSGMIGAHFRYGQTVILSDYMSGEGKDVTDPSLDIGDFIGKSFRRRRTANCTSFPTSNPPTSIGFATTGSPIRSSSRSSRPNTAMSSAFP